MSISWALLPLVVRADVWVQLQVAHPLVALLALTFLAVAAVALVAAVRSVVTVTVPSTRPVRHVRRGTEHGPRVARPRPTVTLASGNGPRAPGARRRRRTAAAA